MVTVRLRKDVKAYGRAGRNYGRRTKAALHADTIS
jgi:hypothetical protein